MSDPDGPERRLISQPRGQNIPADLVRKLAELDRQKSAKTCP